MGDRTKLATGDRSRVKATAQSPKARAQQCLSQVEPPIEYIPLALQNALVSRDPQEAVLAKSEVDYHS